MRPNRETPQSDSLKALVDAAGDSVKGILAGARGLRHFLSTIDKLSVQEREQIVDQAIAMLEGFYAHLPLKRAMHGIDPLQQLRLLRRRASGMESEIQFHHEMTAIFTSLRDLHTNYLLPDYFGQMVAFLPFRVRHCYENGARKYLVSERMAGITDANFVPGVELTYWNAVPIDRAVEMAAALHAGSNEAARHARGVDGLTFRSLLLSAPPDEEWVTVGYTDLNGADRELEVEWTVTPTPAETVTSASAAAADEIALGVDLEGEMRRRTFAVLFRPDVITRKRKLDHARSHPDLAAASGAEVEMALADTELIGGLESTMPDVFNARTIPFAGRTFGLLRIRTFAVSDASFIPEVKRLLGRLPQEGLVVDVRGNGGGIIYSGERLLQLLTPQTIEPTRAQFIATPMTVQLCRNTDMLAPWRHSLERAAETGAAFSAAFPITPPESCNDEGQCYYGPVVLITDARCYSTTDMFTAGFKDHGIGVILGVDANVGAGGANVWTLDLIRRFFDQAHLPPPLTGLPRGAGMRVAIRRTLRVGPEAGTEIEDLGIAPDRLHQPTRNDILNADADLLQAAATILAQGTARRLTLRPTRAGNQVEIAAEVSGADRLDCLIDDRPVESRDIAGGPVRYIVPAAADAKRVELRAYAAGRLVARRREAIISS